jgi:DNA helicase-2/ATP-dependent DNA helicase PcrA
MSLHSAKGLEFAVVFLVGLEENLLPHARSLFDKEQLAEERRLCYVGITRAKDKLYFTHARKRWLYGGVSSVCRSRFLDDLDPTLLAVQRLEETSSHAGVLPWQKNFRSTKVPTTKPLEERRQLDLSDTQLDELLNGDLDFETFLKS